MPDLEDREADFPENQRVLLSNLAAVRAVCGAVESTYGPKGLDCMLVDEHGEIVLTNDGVTILRHLDVSHPVSRLLIQAAIAQEKAVGDGTTTAVILAGALIGEGANQVLRGVPVTRVIDGIKAGLERASHALAGLKRPIEGCEDPALAAATHVAARGDTGLARTVLEAARQVGVVRLRADGFSLAGCVLGLEGASDGAFGGLLIEREPVAPEMQGRYHDVKVLTIEGALEPDSLPSEALASAAGLAKAETRLQDFRRVLAAIAEAGVGLILAGRGIADGAVQFLTDRGILAFRRVAERDLHRAAAMTGARLLRSPADRGKSLDDLLGLASLVEYDAGTRLVRIMGGRNAAAEVTVLVGGRAAEVVAERERIAADAASALQQSLKGGVVPGGGAAELALALDLEQCETSALNSYGIACVREALGRPLTQLAINAGFNALEKLEETRSAQRRAGRSSLGIDAETGRVVDLAELGIWDPYPVKEHALRVAGEVCTAVLRIGNVLKMRAAAIGDAGWHDPI